MLVIKMHVNRAPFPQRLAYPARKKTGTRRLTRWPENLEHNVV